MTLVWEAFRSGLLAAREHGRPLLGVSLAIFVPLDLAVALLDDTRGWGDAPLVRWLGALVLLTLGTSFAYAAAIELVAHGRTATRSVRRVVSLVPTLVAITIADTLGILIGLVLLIVPGMVLLAWWAVAFQAAIVEGTAWRRSLGRSRELVRSRFWAVLALVAIVCIAVLAADYGLWRGGTAVLPDMLGAWLGGALADSLVVPWSAAVMTALFSRLVATR